MRNCLFFVCFCYCCLDFVEIFPNFADFIVVLNGTIVYRMVDFG